VPATAWGTLPLLAGLALAETVGPHVEGHEAALKWPNDLLVDGRKAAGVLVEGGDGWAVVGVGLNVDWRGVDRPAELAGSTSMAEAVGRDVDRWRVLAGFIGVFSRRYDAWQDLPGAFLYGYRSRCATLGSRVRVTRDGAAPVEGTAETVAPGGALAVRTDPGALVEVSAGDVEHLRPA
jgi:BirA family biotin operon repressor/biotin-[acetyl-CoA-carboxylase] ligase